jgi:hypothetical protein
VIRNRMGASLTREKGPMATLSASTRSLLIRLRSHRSHKAQQTQAQESYQSISPLSPHCRRTEWRSIHPRCRR